MDTNWPYVVAGYALTAGVLGGYTAWLLRKLRRAARVEQVERGEQVA